MPRLTRFFGIAAPMAGLALTLLASPIRAQESLDRHLYPLSKPIPAPRITIDVSDAPELRPWAERARELARDWFPHLTQLLATERYKPPRTLKIVLKKGIGPPAYATGDTITAKAEWVSANPDDFGMIIHELTHVIQSYPGGGNKPGWLVEGIADYTRWWRYEPEAARTPINAQRASYRDSYRTTAAFLAWVTGKYHRAIVPQLDRALRNRTYEDEIWRKVTGKTVDELWTEFVSTIK